MYVRNADLTIEYLVNRAFKLGAIQVYSDVRPGFHKQIITVWPGDEVVGFPMEAYEVAGWQMSFENCLPSMRRSLESIAHVLKVRGKL